MMHTCHDKHLVLRTIIGPSGRAALRTLLDDRVCRCRQLLPRTTAWRLGYWRRCKNAAFGVPDYIALTGFDDVSELQLDGSAIDDPRANPFTMRVRLRSIC